MAIDFSKYKKYRDEAEKSEVASWRDANARLAQAEATILGALIEAEAEVLSHGVSTEKLTKYIPE